jgi:hypothetical protein
MLSTTNPAAAHHGLLHELATSGVFPNAALTVYGVWGALIVGGLLVAYALFGRASGLWTGR